MNDHIGDTNEMSDTPRTDKESFFPHDSKYKVCDADFARILERELNEIERLAAVRLSYIKLIEAQNDAANAKINRLTNKVAQLYEGADEQKQRIKRLEDAGDELICHLSHNIKTDHSDPIWHSASIKWGKVKKEAK